MHVTERGRKGRAESSSEVFSAPPKPLRSLLDAEVLPLDGQKRPAQEHLPA